MPRTKTCSKCKKRKTTKHFHKNSSKRDGYQRECKECKKETDSKYYQDNKEKYSKLASDRRKIKSDKMRQKVAEYLNNHPCVDCGNSDIRVLTFDHIRDKKYNVTSMMHEGRLWKSIKKEIDKCEVRCANCHYIKHWPDRFKNTT